MSGAGEKGACGLMMRFNLLPPELTRSSRPQPALFWGAGLVGVLLFFLCLFLTGSTLKEYRALELVVSSNREIIDRLLPTETRAKALGMELGELTARVEAVNSLLGTTRTRSSVASGLEHIAHSAEASGEVWLDHMAWLNSGAVTLHGYSRTPEKVSEFLHDLSRHPYLGEVQLQFWQRVGSDYGTVIEFIAQMHRKEGEVHAD